MMTMVGDAMNASRLAQSANQDVYYVKNPAIRTKEHATARHLVIFVFRAVPNAKIHAFIASPARNVAYLAGPVKQSSQAKQSKVFRTTDNVENAYSGKG